jgi:hypothetical protein
MMALEDIARRILLRASKARTGCLGGIIVAAAAAVVPDEAIWPAEPTLRLHCAAAAGWALPHLAPLIAALSPDARMAALAGVECLLARIDAVGTWQLILDAIGKHAACESPVLGLEVAAMLEPAEAYALFADKVASNSLFARQLHADTFARNAQLTLDETLRPVPDLFTSESIALLAGFARRDPQSAADFADEVLNYLQPWALQPGLDLLAEAMVAHGAADELARRSRRSGFIAEQAAWTRAAALSGGMQGEALVEQLKRLQPRVVDELDANDLCLAALPLLMAMSASALAPQIPLHLKNWQIPLPDFVTAAFLSRGAVDVRLTAIFQGEEGLLLPGRPAPQVAWLAAATTDRAWLAACTDVLSLAGSSPWRPVPGTVAAVLRWDDR